MKVSVKNSEKEVEPEGEVHSKEIPSRSGICHVLISSAQNDAHKSDEVTSSILLSFIFGQTWSSQTLMSCIEFSMIAMVFRSSLWCCLLGLKLLTS